MITRVLLLLSVVFASLPAVLSFAQDPPPPLAEDLLEPAPVGGPDAAVAEAHAVEVYFDALGADVTDIEPTPSVLVELQGSGLDNGRDSILDAGPLLSEDASVARAYVGEVTADADLGVDGGIASAVAEIVDADVLALASPVPGIGLVTADVVRAQASATCAPQTPEEAAAGSVVVGLTIAGQPIDLSPGINSVIEVPGVARVTVLDVRADQQGKGWTVRGLVVETLDPITGLADAEVVLSEAHVALGCEGDVNPEPTEMTIDKTVRGEPATVVPGAEITYDIAVTNTSDGDCLLERLTDVAPAAFEVLGAGDGLDGVASATQADGRRLVFTPDVLLAPGATFVGSLQMLVPDETPEGTYRNLARAFSTCGHASSGLDAPVVVARPPEPPPEEGCFASGQRSFTAGGSQVGHVTSFAADDFTVRLSDATFSEAPAAVLARDDDFPDALAASGLAAELCAPLLVNPVGQLSSVIETELSDLGVDTVYLSGGPAALGPAVEDRLRTLGYDVRRIGGQNRYETAVAIAQEIVALGGPVDQVTLARADVFADAMSATNLATWRRAPILLTDSTTLSTASLRALPSLLSPGQDSVYITGGSDAIDSAVEDVLVRDGYQTTRLAGEDRFGTSRAILAEIGARGSVRDGAPELAEELFNPAFVAAGDDFVAALAGGVAAFVSDGTLILTNPEDLDASPDTRVHLSSHAATIDQAALLGSTSRISTRVEQQILDAISEVDER